MFYTVLDPTNVKMMMIVLKFVAIIFGEALATRFEVDHPQYPSLHIPYENVKEIVNLRTGRRIIFRHIPKEAQLASFSPSVMKIVEEL